GHPRRKEWLKCLAEPSGGYPPKSADNLGRGARCKRILACAFAFARSRKNVGTRTRDCASVTNRGKRTTTSAHRGLMADDPDPPRPQRKPSGNSAEALRALLERHGLHELLEEVDRHRGLTLFGACCEAGLRKRPEPVGGGSQNAARTRAFFFNRALMAAERADAPQGVQPRVQPPVQRPPRIRRSAPDAMPDLAAACAEAFDRPRERAPRPRVTTRMRP